MRWPIQLGRRHRLAYGWWMEIHCLCGDEWHWLLCRDPWGSKWGNRWNNARGLVAIAQRRDWSCLRREIARLRKKP